MAPPPPPLPLIFLKWGYRKRYFFFITFLWLRVKMLCKPSFRNYQMHGVCGYSVVQFLFHRLETGEKNIPIYDLVLSLTAGREGGGGGQGKRAKTPWICHWAKGSILRFNCRRFLSQRQEIWFWGFQDFYRGPDHIQRHANRRPLISWRPYMYTTNFNPSSS